jgi:hypothetical protein
VEWLTKTADWSVLVWDGTILALACAAVSILGGAVVAFLLVKMRADYFCEHCVRGFWVDRHPVLRWSGRVLKNVAGAVLVVLGGVLALPGVPGPGVLTILIGITLLDFPGKRRMERWLVGRPAVLGAINRLRRRYGKPPVVLEPTSSSG